MDPAAHKRGNDVHHMMKAIEAWAHQQVNRDSISPEFYEALMNLHQACVTMRRFL